MKCPRCKCEVNDQYAFCPQCRYEFTKTEDDPIIDDSNQGQRKRKELHLAVAAIVAIVVFTILAIIAIIRITDNPSSSDAETWEIVLPISAPGLDEDGSRIPLHITGTTSEGTRFDENLYANPDGSGVSLELGTYSISAAGSPIAADGTIYHIPTSTIDITLNESAASELEAHTASSSMDFVQKDPAQVTDDDIRQAESLVAADPLSSDKSNTLSSAARRLRDGDGTDLQAIVNQYLSNEQTTMAASATQTDALKAETIATPYGYSFTMPASWSEKAFYDEGFDSVMIGTDDGEYASEDMTLISFSPASSFEDMDGAVAYNEAELISDFTYDNGNRARLYLGMLHTHYLVIQGGNGSYALLSCDAWHELADQNAAPQGQFPLYRELLADVCGDSPDTEASQLGTDALVACGNRIIFE